MFKIEVKNVKQPTIFGTEGVLVESPKENKSTTQLKKNYFMDNKAPVSSASRKEKQNAFSNRAEIATILHSGMSTANFATELARKRYINMHSLN